MHKHKEKTSVIRAWVGPIKGARRRVSETGGNIVIHQRCSCGAERQIAVNWREVGPWVEPEAEAEESDKIDKIDKIDELD